MAYAEGAQELTTGLRTSPQHQTSVTFVKCSSATACETASCSNTTFDKLLTHYNIENIGTSLHGVDGRKICLVFFKWGSFTQPPPSPLKGSGGRERGQEQEKIGSGQNSRVQSCHKRVPGADVLVMFTQSPWGQAQHSRQISSVTLLSPHDFHHVGKPASPLEWQQWLILRRCVSVFSVGWRFHSPFLTPYRKRICQRDLCHSESCPSWSGRVGNISTLLSNSLVPLPQYVVDCTDESLTIVMSTSALLPPSLSLPNQQNFWNSFVLQFLWNEKWWLLSRSQIPGKPPGLCYIYKERWFTLKTGQVRSCKWDFAHKVTNETLAGDLSLLLAPSLGHFFSNCSLLPRHTSSKIVLFSLSKELYSYGLFCSWNIVS